MAGGPSSPPTASRHPPAKSRWLLLIALFKLAKAIILVAAGIGVFRLLDPAVAERVENWLAEIQLEPGRRILAFLTGANAKQIEGLGVLAFGYASLFLVEGVGLLMRKRWAEWFTIIVTASLLPFEIYELTKGASAAKIATIAINVAVVVYLVMRVRKRA